VTFELRSYCWNTVTVRCRYCVGFYVLLLIAFFLPVISHSADQKLGSYAVHKVQLVITPTGRDPWLGSYAANKIPLREVISSKYLIHISTGAQSALSTRLEEDKQRFITDCKSDGGHAIVNTTISVSVGEVLLGSGSATQYGFLLTFAGDCVTDSKLAAK